MQEIFNISMDLLSSSNSEIWSVISLTLLITIIPLILAVIIGVPLGATIALKSFPGKKTVKLFVKGGIGLPSILIGLFISFLILPGIGIFSFANIYRTKTALGAANFFIILPIIIGFTAFGIEQINPKLILKFRALGASQKQLLMLVLWETRYVSLAGIIVSLGRVLSDAATPLMIGGNLPGKTQTMATVILMETHQGGPETALALGLVLFLTIFILGILLLFTQNRSEAYGKSNRYN